MSCKKTKTRSPSVSQSRRVASRISQTLFFLRARASPLALTSIEVHAYPLNTSPTTSLTLSCAPRPSFAPRSLAGNSTATSSIELDDDELDELDRRATSRATALTSRVTAARRAVSSSSQYLRGRAVSRNSNKKARRGDRARRERMLASWTREGRRLGHRLVMDARPWWRRPTLVTTRTVGTNAGDGEASSSGTDEQRAAVEAKEHVQSTVLATFGSWFAQRGGEIHAAVKMVYRPGAGWALEADGEIPSGERLVYLPTALMLGCGKDGMSEPLRQVTETIPDEFWSSRLGLVLLRERVAGNTRRSHRT